MSELNKLTELTFALGRCDFSSLSVGDKAIIGALLERAHELQDQYNNRTPTEWAYAQACTALEKHRERADKAEAERDALAENEKSSAVVREAAFESAFNIWHEKTEWVQKDRRFDVLLPWGKHRADVLREYIERLEAQIAELAKQGCQTCGGNIHVEIDHGDLGIEHMVCPKCTSAVPAVPEGISSRLFALPMMDETEGKQLLCDIHEWLTPLILRRIEG